MQKFGLKTHSSSRHSAIELQIVKEQASALGRAGRKLRLSLERYQLMFCDNQGSNENDCSHQERDSILEISDNVWELMLQREFLGFTENNFKWINQNYNVPEPVLVRLGQSINGFSQRS